MTVSSIAGNVVLLIPAYKPSSALPSIVRAVLSVESPISEVIIVDDGSGPDYREIFQSLREIPQVVVLRHAVNLGKGAALKTGFNTALVTWPDAAGIVTADADGQHAPPDIVAVARALSQSPNSLVLGARQFNGNVPWRSKFGNEVTKKVFALATGSSVTDTQTGLRGWPREQCMAALRVPLNGYDFELECLVSGKKNFREVPVETIYIDQNKSSHFNPLLDSMRIYFVFARYCGSAILAALVDSLVFYGVHASGASTAWAQVAGRAAAVSVAFFVTRQLVFHSEARLLVSLAKYLSLVLVMGFVSYNMLELLHSKAGLPILLAKLVAEGLLFLGNFAIQRDFIFVRR